jgi:LytS/YehU family sensor histidine kinase
VSTSELARRRGAGIGLSNLERRLERYYGSSGATVELRSLPERGTEACVRLPVASRVGAEPPSPIPELAR